MFPEAQPKRMRSGDVCKAAAENSTVQDGNNSAYSQLLPNFENRSTSAHQTSKNAPTSVTRLKMLPTEPC